MSVLPFRVKSLGTQPVSGNINKIRVEQVNAAVTKAYKRACGGTSWQPYMTFSFKSHAKDPAVDIEAVLFTVPRIDHTSRWAYLETRRT